MKILNNEQILKYYQQDLKTDTQLSASKKFGAILKEAVQNTATENPIPLQTVFNNPMPGLQRVSLSTSDQCFATDSIEKMINLLDRYREKLADTRISMKQLDPDISEMARGMENLTQVLDSLPADGGLKDILNRTMVTVSLEIGKFYRGDYIST
jgi:hypothetical protein